MPPFSFLGSDDPRNFEFRATKRKKRTHQLSSKEKKNRSPSLLHRREEPEPDLRVLDLPGMDGVYVPACLDHEGIEDVVEPEGVVVLVLVLV